MTRGARIPFKPGRWLGRFPTWFGRDRFLSCVVEYSLADLQQEYVACAGASKRGIVLFRGYWTLLKAVTLSCLSAGAMKMRSLILDNVVAVCLFWVAAFLLIRVMGGLFGTPVWAEAGQLIAAIVGLGIAIVIRLRPAAYFLAGMVAITSAEIGVHVVYGMRAAQGAPSHIAVMAAGALGVVLGALIVSQSHATAIKSTLEQAGDC